MIALLSKLLLKEKSVSTLQELILNELVCKEYENVLEIWCTLLNSHTRNANYKEITQINVDYMILSELLNLVAVHKTRFTDSLNLNMCLENGDYLGKLNFDYDWFALIFENSQTLASSSTANIIFFHYKRKKFMPFQKKTSVKIPFILH